MSKSNKNLNAIIRKANQDFKAIEEIKKITDRVFDSFYEFSRVTKEERKNKLRKISNDLKKDLDSKTNSECLNHLFELKRVYIDIITQSQIDDDKIKQLFLQEVIADIIEPKINLYRELIQSNSTIEGLNNSFKAKKEQKGDYMGVAGKLNDNADITAPSSIKNLITYKLPDGFCQISCSASKEEILNYFMILTKEKNSRNNESYMSEEDVLELVENNFKVFNKSSTGRVFEINIGHRQKSILTYFVYQFYYKYAAIEGYSKKDYVNFLLWSFINYKSDNPKSLASNMTGSNIPVSKNIIQIKHHLV